jgi:hypothetical protein
VWFKGSQCFFCVKSLRIMPPKITGKALLERWRTFIAEHKTAPVESGGAGHALAVITRQKLADGHLSKSEIAQLKRLKKEASRASGANSGDATSLCADCLQFVWGVMPRRKAQDTPFSPCNFSLQRWQLREHLPVSVHTILARRRVFQERAASVHTMLFQPCVTCTSINALCHVLQPNAPTLASKTLGTD